MGIALAIVSILFGPVKWAWNVVQAGNLALRLRVERAELARLRILEADQRRSLETQSSPLLAVYLDDIRFNVGSNG